jgi:hypothetical protein
LRVLEYYSGILILTTNRVGEFDEAIKSRVHCALYYPPLDKKNTLKVWKMNLDRLDRQNSSADSKLHIQFERKEIEEFAKAHWKDGNRWNGRQIKNAFQAAVALADWDNLKENTADKTETKTSPHLRYKHFDTVAVASAHFEHYLMEVRSSDQQRARTFELRKDDYRESPSDYTKRKAKSLKAKKRQAERGPWPTISAPESSDSDSSLSTSEASSDQDVKKRKKKSKNSEKKKKDSEKKGKESKGHKVKDNVQKREQSASTASSSSSDSD